MYRIWTFLALGLAVLPFAPMGLAQAQVFGAATTYNVSVQQVELCRSAACADPVPLGDGALSFDIAGVGVGAAVGAYADTATLATGDVFTHVRVSLSRTIEVVGQTADPGNVGGNCVTDGTAGATNAGAVLAPGGASATSNLVVPDVNAIGGAAPTAGQYAAENITLDNAATFSFLIEFAAPVTVGDTPPLIDVAFSTANAVGSADSNGVVAGGNCIMFPGVPSVTISVE